MRIGGTTARLIDALHSALQQSDMMASSEQAKFRDKVAKNFGGPLTAPLFGSIE